MGSTCDEIGSSNLVTSVCNSQLNSAGKSVKECSAVGFADGDRLTSCQSCSNSSPEVHENDSVPSGQGRSVCCSDWNHCNNVFDELSEIKHLNVHQVNLFNSNLLTKSDLRNFLYESLSCAILDSGTPATVAGRAWMECYLDSLSAEEFSRVSYAESNNTCKFGVDELFESVYKIVIPIVLGSKHVSIKVDVVEH